MKSLRFKPSILAMLILGSACLPAWGQDQCRAPEEAAGIPAPLALVSEALKPGHQLAILAVGSATMFGPEASLAPGTVTAQALSASRLTVGPSQEFVQTASDFSFPKQMVHELTNLVPGAKVSVTVRGGRGLLASEMLVIIRAELSHHHYDLVLWQTGTVEAVRNLPPSEFGQSLLDGAETIHEAGADLILIDPQFSRFLQTNANLDPYIQALQQVGSAPGVVLFRRFELMRNWANEGQIDLERTARSDRKRVGEQLHACLGQHLAKLILDSARS